MSVKLLTEHNLEFLSLKVGCTGLSESIHVKMSHCWKSHVVAHLLIPRMLSVHSREKMDIHLNLVRLWTISIFSIKCELTRNIPPCADPEGGVAGVQIPPLKNHK